jgi:phosphomannomutase
MRAAAQAVIDAGDAGLTIEHAGRLPTPALVLHAISTGRAGVMVTGSHIPFDRNGIKINRAAGELLKSDEAGVLAAIARVRAGEYAKSAEGSAFDSRGMLKRAPSLPAVDGAAVERYRSRYVDAFAHALDGRRIAFYEHSAVGRELIPEIFAALGATVVRVGRAQRFVPIDTENISDEQLRELERLAQVAAADGGPVDAIVSTDGDSDRPLMAAVLPSGAVRFLPGDLLGLVVADALAADAVSVPVSANDAVEVRMRERGVPLAKTRIGSPYVIVSLAEQRRQGRRRVIGWEANGGLLLGSELETAGGTLAALPTRDAVLPLVANFLAATAAGVTLDELWDRLPPRFGRSGLIDDVPPALSRALLAQLTPPVIERFFTPALGFGTVAAIDTTDGVRIRFDNGDVAHLRASGNAPQLRLYSNADTQTRADAIVAIGLGEPDGIVRQLTRALT